MEKQTARVQPKVRKSRDAESNETVSADEKENMKNAPKNDNNNTKHKTSLEHEDEDSGRAESVATSVTSLNASTLSLFSAQSSLFERMTVNTKEQVQKEMREKRIPHNRKLPEPISDRGIAFYAGITAVALLAIAFLIIAVFIVVNL